MKTKPGRSRTASQLLALAGLVAFLVPQSAMASAAMSGGSVTLVEPAGVGVTFDVQTQVLSAIFLSGRPGDPLSLRVSNQQTGFAQGAQAVAGNFGKVIVLSDDLVSLDLQQLSNGGPGRKQSSTPDSLVIVAQFN
jgi:hypothetical protein